ncbi:MAG: FAD-dependent oxidoreductase, partial [Ketobacteraceae bacterium]|nr:FAD-dependent oxidoreductase [Ketobacteraceae bacterium]
MNATVEVFDPASASQSLTDPDVARSEEHLVIVGNGPAGIHLIRELVRHRYPGNITVFGEEAWEPYDRVKLSSLLNGDIQLDAIDNSIASLGSDRIFQHFSCRVTSVDPDKQEVTDQTGRTFHYDKLILATGSKPHVPNIEGADLKGVYCFRNLTDVQHLMARSLRSRRTVIVGGGLLGLEAAKAMQRGNTEVVLVQHSSRVLNRQLDNRAASILHSHIRSLGINLYLNTHLVAINSDNSRAAEIYARESREEGKAFRSVVRSVELSNGESLECDTLIFATGIKPNIDLASSANVGFGRGFKVDSRLATNNPNIYAIGECAEFDGQVWGLVAPGLQQASCLAKNLCGKSEIYHGSISTSRLKVLGIDVFSMGMVGDEHEKLIDKTVSYRKDDCYRKLFIKRGKLVGAIL